MRKLGTVLVILFTIIVICALDHSYDSVPSIGRLLDPVNGCWVSAEPANKNFNAQLRFSALRQPVTVWLDSRMVPHIHAGTDHDAYYVQGYVHAYFRLWQMDLQTRAAAGRISEILGAKALTFDRTQRRKGMVYAAENSLHAMEAEPHTKMMLDAYTDGVNAFINGLSYKSYPLEYKLMGFKPEPWTNIKTALFLKYMADDLTGYTEDIPLTYLREMLPEADFKMLFPERTAGSMPVIPMGTEFDSTSLDTPHVPQKNIWGHFVNVKSLVERDEGKGSNNWAISGTRTKSGVPILCNDPHLGINLPSLWYEMQLQSPGMNVYGVSLPGAPGIVIGFNDSISWGFTNNYRDVKDFYAIKAVAGSKTKYWFAGKKVNYTPRVERISIKGGKDFLDTVNYTVQGPVMYDRNFHGPAAFKQPLAMCWMAHRATNELLAVYLMNRAANYPEFEDAIMNYQCPAQNMLYADKEGNIALWGQGQFVNKWKEQGRYIMNGSDSSTLWKEFIPMRENPHSLNPEQGYLCSANQSVTDSTYPYYYNGYFYEFRAWRINHLLAKIQAATVQDMFTMQGDTYSILAENTLPVMLRNLPVVLSPKQRQYADILKKWNYRLEAESIAATIYQIWWNYLYNDIWSDEFANVPDQLYPSPERTMQLLRSDSTMAYYDDITTPATENLKDMVLRSYQQTMDSVAKIEKTGLQWYLVRNTVINHLTKIPSLGFNHIKIGGWGNTINAAKKDHAPSWRMVVQMSRDIEAYGNYPGGQSGNPGSKYYADFIDDWAEGKYYRLSFLPNLDKQDAKIATFTWTLQPE